MTHVMALTPGTELVGDFRIARVLGAGGFGITYLADEIALARSVTIKEYFPTDYAARRADQGAVPRSSECSSDYKWGLDRFIEEAKTLARFDHRNICRVYRYFRANNTGYMVLHFEEGASFKGWLKNLGRAPRQTELDKIVAPLLDALEVIHKADFLHRDIAPDNIMVRKDGSPVLIDFGSARGDIARHSRTVSALVKPGYSPYEQYAEKGEQQGPWTDIYAFAATLYHAITGKRPPDSPSRVVKDEYVSAKAAALAAYRPRFLGAIDRALDLDIERRPRSIAEWRGDLLAPEPKQPKKGWLAGEAATPAATKRKKAVVPAPSEGMPPPPDAPGPKGGILDFFEGLKKKAQPKPGGSVTAGLSLPPPPPSVQAPTVLQNPPSPPRTRKEKSARAAVPPPPPPARVETPAALPRPRQTPTRRGSLGRRAVLLLLVGAGLASAAVGLRDRIPAFDMQRAAAPASDTARAPVEFLTTLDIKGHTGGTTAIGFAGDQVVTAGSDNTLKVWSGSSGSLQRTIVVSGSPLTTMALLGRRAVTGQADGTATLWDLDRGDKLATFQRNGAHIWAAAFAGSPDRITTASHDWSVAIWDASAPSAPIQLLEGHESAVQAVAFSAPKGTIASGGADRLVKLWNMETGSLVRTYRGHKDFITAVDFSNDGRLVAAASLDGSIRVWSTASTRLVATVNGHRGRVNAIVFAPAGETLASVGEDGSLRLWEARRGRLLRLVTAGSDQGAALKAVAFTSNGRRLAVGGDTGGVKVRDLEAPASTARAGKE
jgi:WD40 repeat protein/serine/threonine protein kinase